MEQSLNITGVGEVEVSMAKRYCNRFIRKSDAFIALFCAALAKGTAVPEASLAGVPQSRTDGIKAYYAMQNISAEALNKVVMFISNEKQDFFAHCVQADAEKKAKAARGIEQVVNTARAKALMMAKKLGQYITEHAEDKDTISEILKILAI